MKNALRMGRGRCVSHMVAQKDKQLSFITAAPPIHRTGQEKPVTRLRHRGDETFVFPVNLSGFYIIVFCFFFFKKKKTPMGTHCTPMIYKKKKKTPNKPRTGVSNAPTNQCNIYSNADFYSEPVCACGKFLEIECHTGNSFLSSHPCIFCRKTMQPV